MTDEILLMNISRIPDELVATALQDISAIRDLKVTPAEARKFLERQISLSHNPERNQVNGRELLARINDSDIGRYTQHGKLILIDNDLYYPQIGWCFGGFSGTDTGLGYILMSSARMQTPEQAVDILRHELGHMFGAPSEGRTNTYQHLGLHCSNNLCVMQQKDTVSGSVKYAAQRARAKAPTYCAQCERDIREHKVI
jgi:predicted Zn-dependent protease